MATVPPRRHYAGGANTPPSTGCQHAGVRRTIEVNERHDDLQEIIDAALREMAAEEGDGFDPQAYNLTSATGTGRL